MTTSAIYTRVSTEEQADEGLSLDMQEQRTRAVALERGADVVEVYRDDGYSGTRFDRPALQRMLADLDDLDMIVVWRLDRLSRSVRDWAEMMELFAARGVGLISLTEAFDFSTPLGRAMLGMLAVWAQLFVDILRENVRATLRYRAETGLHHGREPYGYAYQDGDLVVVPEQAAVIREVFARYLAGDSLRQIGQRGQADGWPPGPQGGAWNASKARVLLTNPVYAGLVRFSGEVYEGTHDTLLSMPTWRRAQERIAARRNRRGRRYETLSGLFRCGLCGGRMSAIGSAEPGESYNHLRYVCWTRLALPAEERHQPCGISVLPADTMVRVWARQMLSESLPRAIADTVAERAASQGTEIDRIERELAQVESRLRYYHSAGAEGTLPLDMVRDATAPLARRREALQTERAGITAALPAMPVWAEEMAAAGIDDLFARSSHEEQVERLSQIIDAIDVYPDWRVVIRHRVPLPDREVQLPRYAMRGDGLEANIARALNLDGVHENRW